MENRRRKLAGILFCAAIIAGLLSGAARADADRAVVGLGTDVIKDQGKVWFGAYAAAVGENKEPVSWIAMKDGNVAGKYRLLVSEYLFGELAFNFQSINNKWTDSSAQNTCTVFYDGSGTPDRAAFSEKERSAIAETNKSDSVYHSKSSTLKFSASPDILNGDHVFFLSAEETEGFFTGDKSRIANYKDGKEYRWWLRSPVSGSMTAVGIVDEEGRIGQWESFGHLVDGKPKYCGARPAFNLKWSAVLFSSKSGTDEEDPMYKLTLYDSGRGVTVSGTITRDSENPFIITVPYEIDGEANNHISLLITDGKAVWTPEEGWSKGAETKAYEAKAVNVESGDVAFFLSGNLNFDEDRDSLKVWLLAEQVNGAHETDFASEPVEITPLIPHRHAFRFSAGTGVESNTVRAECTRGCEITEGLTVILSAPENAIYDGQPKAAALNTDYDAVIFPNGPYAIQYRRTGDTSWQEGGAAPTDAGNYEAMALVEGETAEVAFTIEPRSIETATVRLKKETLTYNGTEQRVYVMDVTLDGMQLAPSCYGAVEETTARKDAGNYTARVAGKGNYGGIAEADWQIMGKAAVLAAKDSSKVYGETDPTFVATSSGTVGGDKLNYTLTREEGEDARQYLIRVVPGKNPNYIVETAEGILTIEKRLRQSLRKRRRSATAKRIRS